MKTRSTTLTLTLTAILSTSAAFAQQRPPSVESCQEVVGPGFRVLGTRPGYTTEALPPGSALPSDEFCRRARHIVPVVITVVDGDCHGVLCTVRRTPVSAPTLREPSMRISTTTSSSGYSLNTRVRRLEVWAEMVKRYVARLIVLEGRVDAMGRRLTTVEQVLETYGEQISLITDSILNTNGIDRARLAELAVRRDGEENDDAAMERVSAAVREGSRDFNRFVVRLGERTTTLETLFDEFEEVNGRGRFTLGGGFLVRGIGGARSFLTGLTLGGGADLSRRAMVTGHVTLGWGQQNTLAYDVFGLNVQALLRYRLGEDRLFSLVAGLDITLAGTIGQNDPNRVHDVSFFAIGPAAGVGLRYNILTVDLIGVLPIGLAWTERPLTNTAGQVQRDPQGNVQYEGVRHDGVGWGLNINFAVHI